MKLITTLFAAGLLGFSQLANAIDLQTAKSQGLVGETPSGYLAAVKKPSTEVQNLITTVNSKRKEKYKEIAIRNKTDLSAVEKLAGKKAIEKSSAGSYIKQGSSWTKK